jgi:Domain of Unknown Function (DUF326)
VIQHLTGFKNLSSVDKNYSCKFRIIIHKQNHLIPMKKSNCIDACLACVVTCESCVTDCLKTGNQQCVLLCRDCADICALCARFEARDSPYYKELCDLCAKVCRACAEECTKHAAHHECCKECAAACRKCADICAKNASTSIQLN